MLNVVVILSFSLFFFFSIFSFFSSALFQC
jgi:hypothetical protein